MHLPKNVRIVEVGPRDGLQNERHSLPTEVKIEFINRLSATGLSCIEIASFVPPQLLPQMSDGAAIVKGITEKQNVTYPVLVPNLKGLENALKAGAQAIQVIASASETFSRKNANCSIEEGLSRCADIIAKAKEHNLKVRGYISCCLGCPYEGKIGLEKIVQVAQALCTNGCLEIAISDTNGVGTPKQVQNVLSALSQKLPGAQLAVHFHDTYGQSLANIFAALELGISIVDGSVAGLGGCPYARGATGNVATEDVVYMLHGLDIKTDVDLAQLISAGNYICQELDIQNNSKVARALGETPDTRKNH